MQKTKQNETSSKRQQRQRQKPVLRTWLQLLGKPFEGPLSLGSVCAHHLTVTGPDFPTRKDEEDQASGGFMGFGGESTKGSRVYGGVPGLEAPHALRGL